MKKIAISQSNYIPWKGYFDAINFVDEFILLDDVQYTKRDWRNRNKIKTPHGTLWLSIPVESKGKFSQSIKDVRISTNSWCEEHWKTIKANYARSKCFKDYEDLFLKLYLESENISSLSEINKLFIEAICKILNITTTIKTSMGFNLSIDTNSSESKNIRLIDICKKTKTTDYYSGPAAKAYIDEELFTKDGITIHYFDYSNYPTYNQLFGDFIHEVSILDLIFNEGPNAYQFMKSFNLN